MVVVVPASELRGAFFLLDLLVVCVAGVELVDGAAGAFGRVEDFGGGGDAGLVLAGLPGLGGGDLAQVRLDGVLDASLGRAACRR